MTGDLAERHFFNMIKTFLDTHPVFNNLAVIHGWRSKDFKSNEERQADFLIVSGQHRIIINIEVKHSWSKGSARKVAEQHYKNRPFLENLLGELVGEGSGWSFVRCAAYYQHDKVS